MSAPPAITTNLLLVVTKAFRRHEFWRALAPARGSEALGFSSAVTSNPARGGRVKDVAEIASRTDMGASKLATKKAAASCRTPKLPQLQNLDKRPLTVQ